MSIRTAEQAGRVAFAVLPSWSNGGAFGTYVLLAETLLDSGMPEGEATRLLDAAFVAALQERDTARAKGMDAP